MLKKRALQACQRGLDDQGIIFGLENEDIYF